MKPETKIDPVPMRCRVGRDQTRSFTRIVIGERVEIFVPRSGKADADDAIAEHIAAIIESGIAAMKDEIMKNRGTS